MRNVHQLVLGLLLAATVALPSISWGSGTSIGHKVKLFTLKDYRGKEHALAEYLRDNKAVGIVFVGTECPLAKLYGPRME